MLTAKLRNSHSILQIGHLFADKLNPLQHCSQSICPQDENTPREPGVVRFWLCLQKAYQAKHTNRLQQDLGRYRMPLLNPSLSFGVSSSPVLNNNAIIFRFSLLAGHFLRFPGFVFPAQKSTTSSNMYGPMA